MRHLWSWVDGLVNRLVKNLTLWVLVGLAALVGAGLALYRAVFPTLPTPQVYARVIWLDQGWTEAQREKYYQTTQGTLIVPYSWFLSLEQEPQGFPPKLGRSDPFSRLEAQVRYGLLPDVGSRYNPDLLPVGLVKDVVDERYVETLGDGHREWLSISCAACHTGQLVYRGLAVRIDGNQSMWNFAQWSGDLVSNLMLTAIEPKRFERFAKEVLRREGKPWSRDGRDALRRSVRRYLASPLIKGALNAILNHVYPTPEGNARTAALGRGLNGEFGLLDQRNIVTSRGPASFPPVWYTHDFDWVQSVAAIRQPMGRNITEAWGVSVRIELTDRERRFESTAKLRDMFWMETLLSVLTSPPWPEQVFGAIDPAKVARGRYLYEEAIWDQAPRPEDEQLPADPKGMIAAPSPNRPRTGYCARCHTPVLEPGQPGRNRRNILLPLYRLDVLGTDPHDAQEFAARQVYTGPLRDVFANQERVGVGEALLGAIGGIQKRWYEIKQVPPDCQAVMNGFEENAFRAPLGYPARPMAGYWATGPFLHNGSVRTLYQLLGPASDREVTFRLGSADFDPVMIGLESRELSGTFLYDTRIPGNGNGGHEFRSAKPGEKGVVGPALSPEDRLAIIEYMKVLQDVKTPGDLDRRRRALLDVMREDYEDKLVNDDSGRPMPELCRDIVRVMSEASTDEPTLAEVPPPSAR